MPSIGQLHQHTPGLTVSDARGVALRSVAYCRASAQEQAEARITARAFDLHGRDVAARDPRAWSNGGPANRTSRYSLSGRTLLVDSCDAGWRLSLLTEAGPVSQAWDSRGSIFHSEYDEQLRATARHEQLSGEPSQVVERLLYGGADLALHNQCGRLLRHDDPAGTVLFERYALGGQLRVQRRRFLDRLHAVDWPVDADARDLLLEPGAGYRSETRCNPVGDPVLRIDALGNRHGLSLDPSGALRRSTLQLAGSEQPVTVRQAIHYDAVGRVISETAGNGVVTGRCFCPLDGRLQRQWAQLPGQATLQDLRYQYDPVGNILGIEDVSQPVGFYRNQRVAAQQTLVYDSLNQLIEAHGVEVDQPSHGPGLPPLYALPLDPARLINYQQHYSYDAAGNLLQRRHSNAVGLRMAVAARSNRALPERPDGSLPDESQIAAAHDACGNLVQLQGQAGLRWNARNQLDEVRQVVRATGGDDVERYVYAADGSRVRKIAVTQARSRSLHAEVRYLPGLELHQGVTGASRAMVLVDEHLRIEHEQWRYSLGDHLGSIALELDGEGTLLSREAFYPFGGTAVWAARSAVQGERKSHRYCGKEHDASGLYCFGLRYYAPWLARWVGADPLGEVDGLNLYRMVLNNPLSLRDATGGYAIPAVPLPDIPQQVHFLWEGSAIPAANLYNAFMFKELNPEWQVNILTSKPSNYTSTLLAMEDSLEPAQRDLARSHGRAMVIGSPDRMFDDLAFWYPQAHKIRSLYAREGNGPFWNPAALSDIGRLASTQAHGGLYTDFDVAVGEAIDLSSANGDFFVHTEGGLVSNGVMAALPGSGSGRQLLDRLLHEYSPQSDKNLGTLDAGWVGKRSTPGNGLFSRWRLTMWMSGPSMIRSVLGEARIRRDQDALPSRAFYSRRPMPASDALQTRDIAGLFFAGYDPSINAEGHWTAIRPGRRASIG